MIARVKTLLVFVAMSMPAWSQTTVQQHFVMKAAYVARAVVQAFSNEGVEVAIGQVSLLTNAIAIDPSPSLDVVSIDPFGNPSLEPGSDTSSKVKIVCHVRGTCVPFYVLVRFPADATKGFRLPASATSERQALATNPAFSTMHLGDRATLVLNDDRAQIRISVVSLENGSAGQTIRVASVDRRHVYHAEVVNGALLKGRF